MLSKVKLIPNIYIYKYLYSSEIFINSKDALLLVKKIIYSDVKKKKKIENHLI